MPNKTRVRQIILPSPQRGPRSGSRRQDTRSDQAAAGEAQLAQQSGGLAETLGPEKMLEGVLLCENPRIVELAEGSAGGLHRGQRGPGSI